MFKLDVCNFSPKEHLQNDMKINLIQLIVQWRDKK